MKASKNMSLVAACACVLAVGCSKKSEDPASAEPATPAATAAKLVEGIDPAAVLAETEDAVTPIPEGFFTVTPSIVVPDVDAAIDFYVKVFGAERTMALAGPDGKTMHGEMRIGDSPVMLTRANPAWDSKSPAELGGTNGSLNVWTEDPDGVFAIATEAGAKPTMPVALQFWGDRYGSFTDPFGHVWAVMKHEIDVPPEKMAELGARAMKNGGMLKNKPPGKPATNARPEGYHTVTPAIHLAGGVDALDFFKQGLDAQIENIMLMPDGKSLMHAELVIGDSRVMVSSENEQFGSKSAKSLGGSPVSLYIYTEKVDPMFARAMAGGGETVEKVSSTFWGDRYGAVRDPSGSVWGIAMREKNLSEEQIAAAMMQAMAGGQAGEAAAEAGTAPAAEAEAAPTPEADNTEEKAAH